MLNVSSLKKVLTELQDLVTSPPEDIRIQINDDDITDVTAYVRGPEGTPFEGGVWKIKLTLDDDFPSVPPKGYFVTKIFHPNVSVKGEICVNTLKKDWKPELGIRHVLLTIKCLLIHPNPESALNEEAGKLLLEKYEDYCKHASMMTSVHGKKLNWNDVSNPISVEEAEETKENTESATNADSSKAASSSSTTAIKKKPAPTSSVPPAAAAKAKKTVRRL